MITLGNEQTIFGYKIHNLILQELFNIYFNIKLTWSLKTNNLYWSE